MTVSEPTIEQRAAMPYAGIRRQVPMSELPTFIPQSIGQVFGYLGQHGIEPRGAPFIRYHVINMDTRLDVEVGVPTAQAAAGNGQVQAGVLPAGRYAALIHTGPYDELMQANASLIEWAKQNGIEWDRFDDPNGDGFVSRYESYLSEPDEKPERTEVAIRIKD
jgi:effector-binding domain-containing protein